MRHIIYIAIALFGFGSFNASAQDIKFAHVRTDSVIVQTESYKAIIREQESTEKSYTMKAKKLQEKVNEIQQEAQDQADSLGGKLDAFWQDYFQGEMEKKQYDMQALEQSTQQALSVLDERLMKLMELYRTAVSNVAASMGLTYVFDVPQQVLYAGPKSKDITQEVKAELIRLDNIEQIHRFP